MHHHLTSTDSLRALRLKDNPQITGESFKKIPKKQFENLRFIDLKGTGVSQMRVANLRKKHPKLRILWNEKSQAAQKMYQERNTTGDLEIQSGKEASSVHKELLIAATPTLGGLIVQKDNNPT